MPSGPLGGPEERREPRRLCGAARRPGAGVVGDHRPGGTGADDPGLRVAREDRGRRVPDERVGGVGAIRGTYAGGVRLTDQDRPKSYVMHASGAGAPGQVRATVQIRLEPSSEGTELTYSADAVVGGPVAGVGQRMMTGVAKRMAGQFFTAVDAELTGAVVPIGSAPSARPSAAAVPDTAEAAVPQVFAGRAVAGGVGSD